MFWTGKGKTMLFDDDGLERDTHTHTQLSSDMFEI